MENRFDLIRSLQKKSQSGEPFAGKISHCVITATVTASLESIKHANFMKIRRHLLLRLIPLLTLATFATMNASRAQGTAFTYQGRLTDADLPANGDYDLKFSIFDDASAGNQVGDSVTNAPTTVSNGLFTVTLDFGVGIFEGSPRWLEIGVGTVGSADFSALTPRQSVTPAPYAIHAGIAASAAPGSVVTSVNGLKDDVTLEAGNNVTLTPNGNTVTIDAANGGGSSIWSQLGSDAFYNLGNVGIGTSTPTAKLDVRGSLTLEAGGSPGLFTGTGASELNRYLALINSPALQSASGLKAGGVLVANDYSYANPGKSDLIVKGSVGIGTATPGGKLTVRTPANSVFSGYGIEHTDGTVRLSTYLDAGYGAWLGTRTAHALNFYVNDGLPSMTINADGSISMVSSLGYVTVGSPNGESGTSIQRGGNRADVRFNGSSLKLVAGPGNGPPSSFNGIAVNTAGNVGIGTDTPSAKLDVRGTTRTCVLTITGGCDLAEPFATKEAEIEPGSVVVIDDENPGQLKLSTQRCDARVAGIISGANGVNTGIAMQQEGTFTHGQNVALTGRVYVRADAAAGAIKPGDLLTTSDTPGHAMKVTDSSKAQGAILGKAMSGLKSGRGFVLVLVTLQ